MFETPFSQFALPNAIAIANKKPENPPSPIEEGWLRPIPGRFARTPWFCFVPIADSRPAEHEQ